MINSPTDPRTVDDVFRCTQESIAPIMEVIRNWFDNQKNDPDTLIFIQRGHGRAPSESQTRLHWGGDAERIFEDIETALARKIGMFLAIDRLMPVETAAVILRQRVIRTLQEHRERPDFGIPELDQLGQAHKDLRNKEDAYRTYVEEDWDGEEDPVAQQKLADFAHAVDILVEQRDAAVAGPNRIHLGFETILDKGIRSAQILVDAMEQGVRDGMTNELVVQATPPQLVDRTAAPTEPRDVPQAAAVRRSPRP
jgi:hypothetical protein